MGNRQLPLREVATLALSSIFAVGCTSTKDCYVSSECDMYGQPMCNTGSCDPCQSSGQSNSWWPWSRNYYPPSRYPIPDVMPLGSILRSHWHVMETNGEAADFVIYRNEFVDNSSELTPYGRDHITEIAARMPSAPFPVLVQRGINNADPELDQIRREVVVRVLTDLGNSDAERRTFVSQPYGNGLNSMEAEQDYAKFRNIRNAGQSSGGQGGF